MGEPPRSPADLHFRVTGIPVRVSPLFWVAAGLLGVQGTGIELVLFVIAAFVSVLVHELGHALLMRRYGESPRIVLLMAGGLAIADKPSYLPDDYGARTSRQQILISLAGPAAGFLLAALIAMACWLANARFAFYLPLSVLIDFRHLADADGSNAHGLEVLSVAATVFMWVNLYWGAMNLLPVYPLDGGQVSRELFTLRDPWKGVVRSLWLSVIIAGILALIGITYGRFFLAILFGMLAVTNYQTLQRFQGGGMGGSYGDGFEKPWR